MQVRRVHLDSPNDVSYELLVDEGRPIEIVSGFLRHLRARGYSPNTLSAYAYDLLHFTTFLKQQQISYQDFTPARSWSFLEYLRTIPSRNRVQRLSLVLCTTEQGGRRRSFPPRRSTASWPASPPSTNT